MGRHIKSITLIIFSLLSCHHNDFDYYFDKLVNVDANDHTAIFPMCDLLGIENIQNKYYRKLYFYGKNANGYLLQKAYSEKDTNWYYYPVFSAMKEGDIAIALLLAINDDIDFLEIVPAAIMDEYKGSGAGIWWDYVHNDRAAIIKLIEQNIQ